MSEVASAYVTLLPSAKGFGRRTESLINGDMDAAGQSGGRKLGGGIVAGVGKVLKVGVAGVAVAAGGIAATGLAKGFGRLKGIEQAQAKLTGLGHDVKSVEKIMKNATDAVTGTAFGLDSAATVAAQVVAAGVKPGKELERTLTLVGDAATIAGTDMDSMGSIFGKVAASGKVQGDIIAQLGDAGIPIIQLLSKELGTSAEETYKLASKGAINFADFQNAMEAGLGGAAQESGKTFSGSMANMQAALGRLGAKVLGGVFSQMPGLFTAAGTSLDKLGPAAEKAGVWLGQALTTIGDAIKAAMPTIQSLAQTFVARVLPVIRQVAGFVRSTLVPALVVIGTMIATHVVPMLQQIATTVVTSLLPILAQAAAFFMTSVLPMLQTVFAYLAAEVFPILQTLADMFVTQVIPAVAAVASYIVTTLWPAIMRIVSAVGTALKPVFDQIVATMRSHVIPALQSAFAKFQQMWPTIKRVVTWVVTAIGVFLKFAAVVLGKVLPPLIKLTGFLFGVVVGAVTAVIGVVVAVTGAFVSFGTKATSAVKKVVKWVGDLKQKITDKFNDAKTWLKKAGGDIVDGLWNAVKAGWTKMIKKVKGLTKLIPGAVKKVLGIKSPSRVMRDEVGVWIPAGIAEGVAKGTPAALQAAQRLGQKIVEQFESVRDSVRQAFSPDLFQGTLEEFRTATKKAAADNLAVLKALPQLQKKGAKGDFLTQLMASGNTELILALAGGSKADLKAAQKDWNLVQSRAGKLGRQVAQIDTKADLGETNKLLRKIEKRLEELDKKTGKEVGKAIDSKAKKGRKGAKK